MVLALDVGERRIGVALASLIARLPSAYTTIDQQSDRGAIDQICDIVAKESITELVVGLPRDMQGNDTAQTAHVRAFVRQLEPTLNIPITMQDEAVTSIQAEERLKSLGKPYSKADIDAEAAVIILQDYLQARERNTA